MSLQLASDLIKKSRTCVISTVTQDNRPEAATVGISHDQKFIFFFGTSNKTRKYQNLQSNSKAAFVVGFDGPETVQVEGTVREVTNAEAEPRVKLHIEKIPQAQKFADDPNQRWFELTPTWLRYTNFTLPEPIFETKDFS